MKTPLQIAFVDFRPSPALADRVREKIEKLERHYPYMTGAYVSIGRNNHRHQQGNLYSITVEIYIPGGKVVYGRGHPHYHPSHEDAFVAIRDAMNAVERQLENAKRWPTKDKIANHLAR